MGRLLRVLLIWVMVASGFAGVLSRAEAQTQREPEFGRYYALVVGINDYRKLPKLKTAVNDASAVHDMLRREFGFSSELLLNAKRADIIAALDRYRRNLKPGDNFLLFYAGHGQLDADADVGFWQPADADPESQVNWISLQGLSSTLRAIPAKHVLVVSDSCFSGVLSRGTASPVRGGDMSEVARLSTKRARTVMTSGGLEPVLDAGGDGHSVFTRAFLGVLRESEGVMVGHELFTKLRPRVIVNSPQTPEYADIRMAGHDGGDFVFVPYNRLASLPSSKPASAPPAASPAAVDPGTYELAFWDSIKSSSNPADYRAYLEAYPKGRFAALARVRAGQTTVASAPPAAAPVPTPKPVEPAPKLLETPKIETPKLETPKAAEPPKAELPRGRSAAPVAQPGKTPPPPLQGQNPPPQAAAAAPSPPMNAPPPPVVAPQPPPQQENTVIAALPPPTGEIADPAGFKSRWREISNQIMTDYNASWRYLDNAERLEETLGYDRVEVQGERVVFRLRYTVIQVMGPFPTPRITSATVTIANAWPFKVLEMRR